jgi:streptomycin 6-kinase
MATSGVPDLDEELRLRLGRRFGSAIDGWFDALPAVLRDLAQRWEIEWGTLIQRGSVSVVIRCRTADGRPAVLKASPARERIVHEAAALADWRTTHVPAVLAVDESLGALLIEAVEPGTPLDESAACPGIERLAALLTSLHESGVRDPGRLLGWCVAFAGMVALEKAAAVDGAHEQLDSLVALASRA